MSRHRHPGTGRPARIAVADGKVTGVMGGILELPPRLARFAPLMAERLGGRILDDGEPAPLALAVTAVLPAVDPGPLTEAAPPVRPAAPKPGSCGRPVDGDRTCMLPPHITGACLPVPASRGIAVR